MLVKKIDIHVHSVRRKSIPRPDGTDYATLLDHADCALYEAKKRGKDQYVLYEPHMTGKSKDD